MPIILCVRSSAAFKPYPALALNEISSPWSAAKAGNPNATASKAGLHVLNMFFMHVLLVGKEVNNIHFEKLVDLTGVLVLKTLHMRSRLEKAGTDIYIWI
jgi:hypothetical protein